LFDGAKTFAQIAALCLLVLILATIFGSPTLGFWMGVGIFFGLRMVGRAVAHLERLDASLDEPPEKEKPRNGPS